MAAPVPRPISPGVEGAPPGRCVSSGTSSGEQAARSPVSWSSRWSCLGGDLRRCHRAARAGAQFRDHLLPPPFWMAGGTIEFVLGTDAVGRDILSRIIYGARYSLLIGLIVVTLSLSVGVGLGLVAGFFRGWLETMIMRLMDIILASAEPAAGDRDRGDTSVPA